MRNTLRRHADVPVLVDAGLMEYPTVLVGGGSPAVEVEVAPGDLVAATVAAVLRLSARLS